MPNKGNSLLTYLSPVESVRQKIDVVLDQLRFMCDQNLAVNKGSGRVEVLMLIYWTEQQLGSSDLQEVYQNLHPITCFFSAVWQVDNVM